MPELHKRMNPQCHPYAIGFFGRGVCKCKAQILNYQI